MGKIVLYLLPLLMELKSMTQSTSNMAQDTSFAVKNVKEAMRTLIATVFTAIILSGLVIFATIRLIERFEVFVRTYEGGDNLLLGFYALLVLAGAGFITYLFKPYSGSKVTEAPVHAPAPSPGIESIVSALITGFFEGMQKEAARKSTQEPTYSREGSAYRTQAEDKGPQQNEIH